MNNCPCGSGTPYSACCEPIITGARTASTAEELMRARYSAHVGVQVDFIFASTHPEHRQGLDRQSTQGWAEKTTWLGLEIISTSQGNAGDSSGEVEFIARFREKEEIRAHHERAQFQRQEGDWYFTDGSMVRSQPAGRQQDRPQRPLSLRQRPQIQEVLRPVAKMPPGQHR